MRGLEEENVGSISQIFFIFSKVAAEDIFYQQIELSLQPEVITGSSALPSLRSAEFTKAQ